jgi:mannose-1-phosphate guanylyltransferase/phosphomannomutase
MNLKAIIMAGGEGTRLRPVSHNCPKPMARLMGRPLLEHIVALLKKSGIDDICVTLRYMPERIMDYFGDGSPFGVRMQYRIEREPLGTAGGVKACMDFIGDEDFLVISGDAACDFDLGRLLREHSYHRCAVTMALYPHADPLQYGLVLTSPGGRVISFIEKPAWERVVTDLVNTGIYVISPAVMDLAPVDQPCDFAKDLFPALMKQGKEIRGLVMSGYWCDVGNPESYLHCNLDALEGQLRLNPRLCQPVSGIWCGSKLSADVQYRPPCLISETAVVEPGAVIGPDTIIGPGSSIGTGAVITASVIDGGTVGSDSRVDGTVVCRDAIIQPGSHVCTGAVIAAAGAEPPPPPKAQERDGGREPLLYRTELRCGNRARIMRALSESLAEFGADFTDGLNLTTSDGQVRISPAPDRDAIVIEASAAGDLRRSSRLCAEYEKLAKSLGRSL